MRASCWSCFAAHSLAYLTSFGSDFVEDGGAFFVVGGVDFGVFNVFYVLDVGGEDFVVNVFVVADSITFSVITFCIILTTTTSITFTTTTTFTTTVTTTSTSFIYYSMAFQLTGVVTTSHPPTTLPMT